MDLAQYFVQRGVALTEVSPGLRVPLSFSGAHAEHMAVRRAAGLFDFSFMACLAVEGVDALAFLHSVQTRNLSDLAVGRLRYTLILEEDRAVLNDATVWRTGENAYLVFTGRRSDIGFLTSRRASLDLELRDESGSYAVIALQGPESRGLLSAMLPAVTSLPYFGFAEMAWNGRRLRVARIGYTGELGYEIVCDADHAPELWRRLADAGATECGFEAADSLRIEAGFVLFKNELTYRVHADEIGLGRLLEQPDPALITSTRLFRAAWRRRGSQLAGLLLDGPAEPVLHPHAVPSPGWALLTSACWSPLLQRWLGLGYVVHADRYPGTRVDATADVRATVARLPFYDPMKRLPRS